MSGGTSGGTYGEMRGGIMIAPFLLARFDCSYIAIVRRGVFGEFSAFPTVS